MSHALSSPVFEFQFDPSSPSSFPAPLHIFLHVFRSKNTRIKPSSSGQPSSYHKTEHLFDLELLWCLRVVVLWVFFFGSGVLFFFIRLCFFFKELSLFTGDVLLTRETTVSPWVSVKVDGIASNCLPVVTPILNMVILGCAAVGLCTQ